MRDLPPGEVTISDWPDLPADSLACLKLLLREGELTTAQAAEMLDIDEDESLRILTDLCDRHLAILIEERVVYVGTVGRRTARFKPGGAWDALSSKLDDL